MYVRFDGCTKSLHTPLLYNWYFGVHCGPGNPFRELLKIISGSLNRRNIRISDSASANESPIGKKNNKKKRNHKTNGPLKSFNYD